MKAKAQALRKNKYDSFGFYFRFYFASMVEEVALTPFLKFQYNTALDKYLGNKSITAVGVVRGITTYNSQTELSTPRFNKNPYTIAILPTLGLTANSDIVSLYLEPSLGLKISQSGSATDKVKEVYALTYGAYAEIYITPLKNLEWYFEADVSGDSVNTTGVKTPVKFASSTGITWYLPAL